MKEKMALRHLHNTMVDPIFLLRSYKHMNEESNLSIIIIWLVTTVTGLSLMAYNYLFDSSNNYFMHGIVLLLLGVVNLYIIIRRKMS